MQASSFKKKPPVLLRLEIEQVISQFFVGLHQSILGGRGLEFKRLRPYDPADSLAARDDAASAKISEDPDLEPVSRDYYAERVVSVYFLLDVGKSMLFPPKKAEYASVLIQLFAAPTFESHDKFRIIRYDSTKVIDSNFIFSFDEVENFFRSLEMNMGYQEETIKESGIFSYLASLEPQDAMLIVVSDFTDDWQDKIKALRRLGLFENNIHPIFFALDEWSDFTPQRYGAMILDPKTNTVTHKDLRKGSEFHKTAELAAKRFEFIKRSVQPLAIPFVTLPLTLDPLDAVRRALFKIRF